MHARKHIRIAMRVAEGHVGTRQVAAEEILVVEMSMCVIYGTCGSVGCFLRRLRGRDGGVQGRKVLAMDGLCFKGRHDGLAVGGIAI